MAYSMMEVSSRLEDDAGLLRPTRDGKFPCAARRRSELLAVEVLDLQRRGIDVVEAARVHRHHRAIGPLAAGEGPDAAGFTEYVMDSLPVELVIGQRVLAFLQRERA